MFNGPMFNGPRLNTRRLSLALILRGVLTVLIAFTALSASADPQSKSYSHWRIGKTDINATFTISTREATRLPDYQYNPDLAAIFANHLRETIHILNDGEQCAGDPPQSQRAKNGYLQFALHFSCQQDANDVTIAISTLQQVAPSHVHFANITLIDSADSLPVEQLFTRRQLQHTININPDDSKNLEGSSSETLLTYTLFGFEHILIGADHIAFLLTLLLLASRVRDIILIVTGFTLGHSVTLSLATLGYATPNTLVVEALIGFTVALVAIENISTQTQRSKQAAYIGGISLGALCLLSVFAGIGPPWLSLAGLALFTLCYLQLSDSPQRARTMRPMVTAAFGLIHGFGFASVLMEVGLPERGIVPALLGFNIGVELGQITIVIALVAIAWCLRHLVNNVQEVLYREILSASLCGIGIFWFVERAYF